MALAAVIAATPFLWLIARDTVMLLRASDGEKKEEAQWILADRLAQAISYSDIRSDAQAPMWSTLTLIGTASLSMLPHFAQATRLPYNRQAKAGVGAN